MPPRKDKFRLAVIPTTSWRNPYLPPPVPPVSGGFISVDGLIGKIATGLAKNALDKYLPLPAGSGGNLRFPTSSSRRRARRVAGGNFFKSIARAVGAPSTRNDGLRLDERLKANLGPNAAEKIRDTLRGALLRGRGAARGGRRRRRRVRR